MCLSEAQTKMPDEEFLPHFDAVSYADTNHSALMFDNAQTVPAERATLDSTSRCVPSPTGYVRYENVHRDSMHRIKPITTLQENT